MNEYDVKRLALVLAVQAEIEGMKVENLIRDSMNYVMTYDEEDFSQCAEKLRDLARKGNDQL